MVPKTATISSAVVPGIAEHHITAVSASKELVEQNETVCLLFTTTSCMYNNQSCERTNFIWRARWSPYTLDSCVANWITWLNRLENDNFSKKVMKSIFGVKKSLLFTHNDNQGLFGWKTFSFLKGGFYFIRYFCTHQILKLWCQNHCLQTLDFEFYRFF